MNNPCLFSIIIPAYNIEKYMHICLDSILKRQDYRDFEVILVNDGSTDSTGEKCDCYAQKDSRVRVIHKANGGASSARNEGIREAKGEFLLFADGDDCIADGCLGKIAAALMDGEGADVVFLKTAALLPDGSVQNRASYSPGSFNNKSHMDILNMFAAYLPECVWEKIVKREALISNNIFFTEGIILEDMDFAIKLFLHAKKYAAFDIDYYYYRQGREGSVMNTPYDKVFTDLLFIIEKWLAEAKERYKEYAGVIHSYMFHQYLNVLLLRYQFLSKSNREAYKKKVDALSWLLNRPGDKKAALVRSFYRLFGLEFVSRSLVLYNKLKGSR